MGSRVAKQVLLVPKSVAVKQDNNLITLKSSKGEFQYACPIDRVKIELSTDSETNLEMIAVKRVSESKAARSLEGTLRRTLGNFVTGLTDGFKKTLSLVGVGYRAKISGSQLELVLGFSHPVIYDIPTGIKINCPSQTEIVVEGIDKQKVGQVSANIRAFRSPDSYKGKGVRYSDEKIKVKEVKKK